MPAKLGLPAAAVVCVLLIGSVAHAQEAPVGDTTTTIVESTTTTVEDDGTTPGESTTTTAATTTTTSTTTTVAPSPLVVTAEPVGPATAGGQTPVRGTQVQLLVPPTTLPAWDPFAVPANSGHGRRVVYSKSKQTVWAFDESGAMIKSHRVSGKQTPYDPAPGVYRVWSRSRYTHSINNPSITWGYMVRFAKGARGGNIGLHEIPYQYGRPVQSIAQLGQALSGGCVRQAVGDAVWMWNWAGIGTVVVVTP